MPSQPTLLGSRGLLSSGTARAESKAPVPPQMGNWKRRLPTIAEDGEEVCTAPLAMGVLPEYITDPFSMISYSDHAAIVIQRLEDGSKTDRRQLFAWLLKALPSLALSEHSSKVVQLALKLATGADRALLASGFHTCALKLCTSVHGHEVLVFLVQNMPVSCVGFVAQELESHFAVVARDRFGSYVLQAMTMHCTDEQRERLAAELAREANDLSRHPHGSSVIQNLLEYAPVESRAAIGKRLISEAPKLAMHRTGTHAIAKALQHCDDEEQHAIAKSLLKAETPCAVVDIACSRCGSSILEEIAASELFNLEFRAALASALPRLGKSKFGRRVLVHFGLTPQTDAEAEQAKQNFRSQ